MGNSLDGKGLNIGYSSAGWPVLEKTVPEILDIARGLRPRVLLKIESTVFSKTDRPRLLNNIFTFFLPHNERRAKDSNILGL